MCEYVSFPRVIDARDLIDIHTTMRGKTLTRAKPRART
jgi:hypothetical protein